MDPHQQWLTESATTLGAVATACAAIYAGYRAVGKPVLERYRNVRAWFRNVGEMARTVPGEVRTIKAEVTHNGGGSLKDAVKRIEKRGLVTEGMLRSRIETDRDIAVITDVAGEVTSVTAGYTEMTGLEARACAHEGWKEAVHVDDVVAVLTQWHVSLRTGNKFVAEFRFKHINTGGVTPCKVIASPVLVDTHVVGWAARITQLSEPFYARDPDIDEAMTHIDTSGHKRQGVAPQ